MNDAVAQTIWFNAARLYREGGFAFRHRSFSTATFLAITSAEEAAKSVIAFCHSYLDERTFKKRFTHQLKQRLSDVIWYAAGALSTTHMVHVGLGSASFDHQREDAELVALHVATLAGWNNPKRMAETIADHLRSRESPTEEAERNDRTKAAEHLRQRSLYVDDDGYEVRSTPFDISGEEAFKRLKFAKLSIAVSSFLISEEIDFPGYLARLPRDERERLKADQREILAGLATRSS